MSEEISLDSSENEDKRLALGFKDFVYDIILRYF